jgi:hypothetical protein
MSQRFQKRDHLEGFAVVFAIIIVAMIVFALCNSADAAGVRRAACAPHVVHHQAAVVAAAIPYPVVGYQVGQYLQQQAVDEHAFRASPSKERLTFLEGYYQAKQEEVQQPAPPQVEDSSTSEPQEFAAPQAPSAPSVADIAANEIANSVRGPTAPIENAIGYEARRSHSPAVPTFAATHPVLASSCTVCHANEESKGGFGIATVVTEAKAAGDCETILAMVDSIATGAMPKGKPMTEAARLQAISELLSK